MGVILITHDMGVIADTTDKVTVMYQGAVVESGPTADILGRPQHAYTKSLIAAVPRPTVKLNRFPLVSYGGRVTEFRIEDLARSWPKDSTERGKTLIEADGITKRFLSRGAILPSRRTYLTAVDAARFEIRQGEVFGLVGESGSGKSTIARMIAGLYPVDAGQVRYRDKDVTATRRGVPDWYRRDIQMIFQDPYSSLNPRMRVDAIAGEPAKHHGILSGAALKARVDELLDRVGLGAEAGLKYPHEFSGRSAAAHFHRAGLGYATKIPDL